MRFPTVIATLAAGGTITAARLHYMNFASAPKFISETFGNVKTLDGQVWEGVGDVIAVDGGGYQSGAVASNLKITVGARSDSLTDELVNAALNSDDEIYGRLYFQSVQFFDDAGQPVDDHYAVFVGAMDQITFSHGAELRQLTLNVESPFVRRRATRVEYFSDADQKRRKPLDKAFEFITSLVNKTVLWPKY